MMKQFFDPEPLIITTGGGGPGLFHDTIKNFSNAISLGSDVIRTNAALTKDRNIVLFSNAVFQNKDVDVTEFQKRTLKELKESFGAMVRGSDDDSTGLFPELQAVLEKYKHQRFNIHVPVKMPELVTEIAECINATDSSERILVSSLDGDTIKRLRSAFPDMATSFSFYGIIGIYALYRSGFLYFKKSFKHDVLLMHEMIGGTYLAHEGLIQDAKKRGLRVYILNVVKEEQAKRLRDAGVDGFVTNYASMIKRILP